MLPGSHNDSVESIVFCELLPYVVSCGMDNKIQIHDLSNMSLRQSVSATIAGGGFTMVKVSKLDGNIVIAASTFGTIVTLDVRNGSILYEFKGHYGPINCFIEVLHDNMSFVVTAGDDSNVHLYNISIPPASSEKVKQIK